MLSHNFLETGETRQMGSRVYRLCGIEGCGQVGNHPIHRDPLRPKKREILDSDRHAPRIGLNKKCTTCGKARQSSRHRGFDPVVIEFPRPKVLAPEPRSQAVAPAPLGGEALLLVALGYAEALQVESDGMVKVYANQLARAIQKELGRGEPAAAVATQEVVEAYHEERKSRPVAQAGTPAMRRAFKSGNLRRLFDHAIEQGWTWRRNGSGHVLISSPGQKSHISLSLTLSDKSHGRAWENAKAEARRKGLDIAGL